VRLLRARHDDSCRRNSNLGNYFYELLRILVCVRSQAWSQRQDEARFVLDNPTICWGSDSRVRRGLVFLVSKLGHYPAEGRIDR
jgi:hypothetical protein